MIEKFVLPACLALTPLAAEAQANACPPEVHQQLLDSAAKASNGELTPQQVVDAGSKALNTCGPDRLALSELMNLFTRAAWATEVPSDERDALFFNALRTAYEIARSSAPMRPRGAEVTEDDWTMRDERNAYYDLMRGLAWDHFQHGRNAMLYRADQQEQFRCGLYPDIEAEAYSYAPYDDEQGELRDRLAYLAANCDYTDHLVSGYTAQYWEAHSYLVDGASDYAISADEISRNLTAYLDQHLAGRTETSLFDAGAVTMLRFIHAQ